MRRGTARAAVTAVWLMAFSFVAQARPKPRAAQSNGQWAPLESYIQEQMREWKVPGLAVGIVRGNEIYAKGFGVRDITTGQPVTANTLFDIGSCTKAFTAASVGILVDEGKMKWDGHVDDYIPFFHLYDPLADEEVTMRDLLTHRTGLGGTDLLWYGTALPLDQIIRRVRYIPPDAGFRAEFQYQNVMYATAGYAVGEVSDGTWGDFVREHIFAPLGMNGADFSANDSQKAADHATPHDERDGKVVTIPWRNIDNVAPAGSINAGAGDMTHWISMQLNDGMYEGKRIVSANSMKEMHTPQMIVPQGGEFDFFFPHALQLSYGMGWFIQDYGGHQILLHPGDIDGFASLVVLIPEVHTGFVILTNLDHTPLREGLGYHLIDQFLNVPDRDWTKYFSDIGEKFSAMEKKAADASRTPKHPGTHPSRELAAYGGTYRNDAYGDAVISLEGDALKIKFLSLGGTLQHFQYDTFVADLGNAGRSRVTFVLDANGDVAEMRTEGLKFTRVRDGQTR